MNISAKKILYRLPLIIIVAALFIFLASLNLIAFVFAIDLSAVIIVAVYLYEKAELI